MSEVVYFFSNCFSCYFWVVYWQFPERVFQVWFGYQCSPNWQEEHGKTDLEQTCWPSQFSFDFYSIQIALKQQYNLMTVVRDNLKPFLPVQQPKQRYYTPQQVTHHNTANDCWVVLFGEVYNLTTIIQQNITNKHTTPLIQAAGTDITYWFDSTSREPRVKVNLNTGERQFYCPGGRYLHVDSDSQVKWWKDSKNIIGKLTKKSRKIRIINMINDHCTVLEVPAEQTIKEVLNRYLKYNKHGGSYIWKRLGRPLDMQKTLEQNGIEDEDPQFDRLDIIHANWYIPAIHLFFSDDLTVA